MRESLAAWARQSNEADIAFAWASNSLTQLVGTRHDSENRSSQDLS
jgi:hypothetical protein